MHSGVLPSLYSKWINPTYTKGTELEDLKHSVFISCGGASLHLSLNCSRKSLLYVVLSGWEGLESCEGGDTGQRETKERQKNIIGVVFWLVRCLVTFNRRVGFRLFSRRFWDRFFWFRRLNRFLSLLRLCINTQHKLASNKVSGQLMSEGKGHEGVGNWYIIIMKVQTPVEEYIVHHKCKHWYVAAPV